MDALGGEVWLGSGCRVEEGRGGEGGCGEGGHDFE